MKLRIVVLGVFASAGLVLADPAIENVQQALKDQGFYYGEITGQKDADTTAAVRRYQIRNGLQITGELNEETLSSIRSTANNIAKSTPSPVRTAAPPPASVPDSSDLRADSAPQNP